MGFISANRCLSEKLAAHFPHTHDTISDNYPAIVGGYSAKGKIIVDVGGGAQCAFATECAESHIIAVDISATELGKNRDVADRRVSDVTESIPVDNSSADVVTSRFVAEHLRNVDGFVREAYRVLKPGGTFVTLFPNKYAVFSLINRTLPIDTARKVAYALKDSAREFGIFPAYYKRCSPGSFSKLCHEHGFERIDVDVMYFQSSYYYFFFPAAALSLIYEWMIKKLSLQNLAAHVLVCARKPNDAVLSLPSNHRTTSL